jgi:hypothetical protein
VNRLILAVIASLILFDTHFADAGCFDCGHGSKFKYKVKGGFPPASFAPTPVMMTGPAVGSTVLQSRGAEFAFDPFFYPATTVTPLVSSSRFREFGSDREYGADGGSNSRESGLDFGLALKVISALATLTPSIVGATTGGGNVAPAQSATVDPILTKQLNDFGAKADRLTVELDKLSTSISTFAETNKKLVEKVDGFEGKLKLIEGRLDEFEKKMATKDDIKSNNEELKAFIKATVHPQTAAGAGS